MEKINLKIYFLAIIVYFVFAGIVTYISLVLITPGQPIYVKILIFGSALVGVAAVFPPSELYKLCSTVVNRHINLPKKIIIDVLEQLNALGDNGSELDRFLFYLARTYPEKNQEERTKIYQELETKGLIVQKNGNVKITKSGKKYIHKK